MRRWLLRVARGLVVLAAAGIVFQFWIPQSKFDRHRLAGLVITHTALHGVPPTARIAESVPPAQSTFAATRHAGKAHPDATGIYAREWYLAANSPPETGVVIQVLPDSATAAKVLAGVRTQLTVRPSLQGEASGPPQRFVIPKVPEAQGASFSLTDASTPSKTLIGYAYKASFQVDRGVVSELIVSDSPSFDLGPIRRDVAAGAGLLHRAGSGLSLSRTDLPTMATTVFVVVSALLAVGVVLLPEPLVAWWRRRRQRKAEREDRRAKEQYLARGRRNVRRQRAPAWTQPRRR